MDLQNLSFIIKSCIACNEHQCPVIKERLDQHVLTHQNSCGSSTSNQYIESRPTVCGEDECPEIRQRLEHHVQSYHPNRSSSSLQAGAAKSICGEDECPAIRERLQHHVRSYHCNRSSSSQQVGAGKSPGTYMNPKTSRTPSVAIVNSDDQTSTANLMVEELKPPKQPIYREALKKEILTWAQDLPKYPNPSAENLKQNIVNELIDKVDRLQPEVNEVDYGVKLLNEISKFLDSLPPYTYIKNCDLSMESLRLKLIYKICNLNNATNNTKDYVREKGNFKKSTNRNNVPNTKTTQLNTNNHKYFKDIKMPTNSNDIRTIKTKTIGTNTSECEFNDGLFTFYKPDFQNKNSDVKKLVDAQVQNSFHNMQPYYGQIYRHSNLNINKQYKSDINEDICKEKIFTWLTRAIKKSERSLEQNDKKILTDVLFNRLRPLLNKKMNSPRYKLILKAEILNFLYDYFMVAVATNGTYFNKLVESLAITLLIQKANSEAPQLGNHTKYSYYCIDQKIGYNRYSEYHYKPIFYKIVRDALKNVTTHSENIENDLTEILIYNIDRLRTGVQEDIKDDLYILLKFSTDLYDIVVFDIVNVIMDQLTYVLCNNNEDYDSIQNIEIPPWSHILSVYKSEIELSCPPKTSFQISPDIIKHSEPKLNTADRVYKERISALISSWLTTLPKKQANKAEDIIIRETIVNSLAVDIMDQVKLDETAPGTWSEKEKYLSFFIYRWLNRYKYFDDINKVKPYVDKLMKDLIEIPLPIFDSQHIKKFNKDMKLASCSQTTFKPEDILEDEIAFIMNTQPSTIFISSNEEIRNQQLHEFAIDMQNSSKNSLKDLTKGIMEWLRKLIKPEEKQKLISLKEQLTERITSLLRGRTSKDMMKKQHDRLPHKMNSIHNDKVASPCCEANTKDIYESENFKKFIEKYIEHNYDVENSITRDVYGDILKTELQKLSSPINKLQNDIVTKNEQRIISTPNTLPRELKYINIIADWLHTIPLPAIFYKKGNRSRIEFVNSLAKNLSDVEKNNTINFTETKLKEYLASIISKYIDQLPIPLYYKRNMSTIVDRLVQEIIEVLPLQCCQIANCNKNVSSMNSNIMTHEQLCSFIETYIRENCEELGENELKLESLSARLFKEIEKLTNIKPGCSNAYDTESINDPVRRLSFELDYGKEITDYINNLPLLPITSKTTRESIVKMISNLAEKMFERWQSLNDDPYNTYVNTILSEHLMQWISDLPLDSSKEIDKSVVLQQLLNRMERVNKRKLERSKTFGSSHENKINEMCKLPYACCNQTYAGQSSQEPGAAIVEAIENWCAELPIQTEDETNNNAIKNCVATNLFKKISELTMYPKCFNDNSLYCELLSVEIDAQLDNLPHSSTLQLIKNDLKQQLLSKIMEKRAEIREQASSTEYKHELEKTIALSLPAPVQTYQEESPGFKIYKDRLATMFILENFDYGCDELKINYKKRIRKDIDKYFQDVKKRNAFPITKDQIYDELYSALFNVPVPNVASVTEEVEEIKTRCEIDDWFETVPLRTASCDAEVLARDQIIAMLAKRIHRMEMFEKNPEGLIHKEIAKWLLKLPLLPGQEKNVDELAHSLTQRLKSTLKNRKCTQHNESVFIDKFIIHKNHREYKGVLGTSQVAGPSNENKARPCPASSTHCQTLIPLVISPNPADMIISIIEIWCHQLPLLANTPLERDNIQHIKDNLAVKLIMKISELNVNPVTFNNDFLYDTLLDDELEHLLGNLSTSNEFNQNKELKKKQLRDAIKSVKPLITKEKSKYEYKQKLLNTIDNFLEEPQNLTPEIKAIYISLKDDIIDNFILYNFYKNNDEGLVYKIMVNVAVEKYFVQVYPNGHTVYSPLMVANHLLCEMAKVPVPSKAAILEEIREIRVKSELMEFFNKHSLCNRNDKLFLRNQIITALVKRLCGLGNVRSTSENFVKIKNNIVKCLNKIEENVDQEKIDSLVQNIQNIPELETSVAVDSEYINYVSFTGKNKGHNQNYNTPAQHQNCGYDDSKNIEEKQWLSLLPLMSKDHNAEQRAMTREDILVSNLRDTHKLQFNGKNVGNAGKSESKINYSNFQDGVMLTSSVIKESDSNNEKYYKFNSNQRAKCNSSSLEKINVSNKPISHTIPKQVVKSFTPHAQGNSKLSEQDSTFLRDIDMQQSNSANNSYRGSNDHKSIPPSNVLNSPAQRKYHQQRTQSVKNRNHDDPSTPDDNMTQLNRYKQEQSRQEENLRKPKANTDNKVPVNQISKAQTTKINHNETNSFSNSIQSDLKSNNKKQTATIVKTKSASSSYDEIGHRFPNLSSSMTIRKSSQNSPLRNMREPSPVSMPSQSLTSIPFTSRTPISDSNIPCHRRPSFLIFNPSGIKTGTNDSAQHTQTIEKERSTDRLPEKESEECKCEKRKKFCKSEIPVCRAHKKKRCKICNGLNPLYCKMPPCHYPKFYYY